MAMSTKQRLASRRREHKLKRRLRRESNLPTWKVTKLENGRFGIECPRNNCRGKAKINGRKWLESKPDYETRSCTYCFAPSWIPQELL